MKIRIEIGHPPHKGLSQNKFSVKALRTECSWPPWLGRERVTVAACRLVMLVLWLYSPGVKSAWGEEAGGGAATTTTVRALILPRLETTLAAEIAGRIESLSLELGDRFAAGKELVVFDCRIHRAELDMAKAELDERRKTVEVNEKLQSLKSVSTLDMATAEVRLQRSQAEIQLRQTQVEKCRIKAPFAGRVSKRHASPHQYVNAGQPLLDLIDDSKLMAQIFVPSHWLPWLKAGVPFSLRIEETTAIYRAKVTAIGAKIDPVSQSIEVRGEIEGNHPELVAGMSGSATFDRPVAPAPSPAPATLPPSGRSR